MKILFVGKFEKQSAGEIEIANAIKKIGHEVLSVEERLCDLKRLKFLLEEEHYDFLLFTKFRPFGSSFIQRLDFLNRVKIPTVCWVFDLYFGL